MPTKKIYSKKNNKIFQKIKCLTHKKKTYKRMTGGSRSSISKTKTAFAIATILKNKNINILLPNLKDKIETMYTYLQKMYNTLFTLYTKFIDKIINTVVQTIIEDVLITFRLKVMLDFGIITIRQIRSAETRNTVTAYFNDNKSNTNDRFGHTTLDCDDDDNSKHDAMDIVYDYLFTLYKFTYLYTDITNATFKNLSDSIKTRMTSHVQNNMMNLLSFYKNSDDLENNLIITKLELLTLLLGFDPGKTIDQCEIYNQLSNIIDNYV